MHIVLNERNFSNRLVNNYGHVWIPLSWFLQKTTPKAVYCLIKLCRYSGLSKAQLKSGWCGWSLSLLFILFASQFLVSRKNPRAALTYNGHAPLPLRSSLHSATFANSLRYIPFLSKESEPQEITGAKIRIVLLYCIGLKGRHSFSSFVMVFLSSFQSQFLKQKFRLHSASTKNHAKGIVLLISVIFLRA